VRKWAKWILTALGLLSLVTGASLKSVLDSAWPNWTVAATAIDASWLLVILGLGLIVAANWHGLTHRLSDSPATRTRATSRESAPTSEPEERMVVDVTPAYLVGFFNDHTSIQARKLTEPYIGKWLRVSGALSDVLRSHIDQPVSQVTFEKGSPFDENYEWFTVYMYFDRTWDDRLAVLRRGTTITVLGQLERVSGVEVHLEHCELVS
jgi:hypothetical protein